MRYVMQSTVRNPADTPCKPAAVAQCLAMTFSRASRHSSATSARERTPTVSTERFGNTASCTATSAARSTPTYDAPAVRPSAVRFRARRCLQSARTGGETASRCLTTPAASARCKPGREIDRWPLGIWATGLGSPTRGYNVVRAVLSDGHPVDPQWVGRGSTPRAGPSRHACPGVASAAARRRCKSGRPPSSGHSS